MEPWAPQNAWRAWGLGPTQKKICLAKKFDAEILHFVTLRNRNVEMLKCHLGKKKVLNKFVGCLEGLRYVWKLPRMVRRTQKLFPSIKTTRAMGKAFLRVRPWLKPKNSKNCSLPWNWLGRKKRDLLLLFKLVRKSLKLIQMDWKLLWDGPEGSRPCLETTNTKKNRKLPGNWQKSLLKLSGKGYVT